MFKHTYCLRVVIVTTSTNQILTHSSKSVSLRVFCVYVNAYERELRYIITQSCAVMCAKSTLFHRFEMFLIDI